MKSMRISILTASTLLLVSTSYAQPDSIEDKNWKVYGGKADSAVTVPAVKTAQNTNTSTASPDFSNPDGKVQEFVDSRVSKIINDQATTTTTVTIKGYRVQLYYDTDKSRVRSMKAKFQRMYEDVPAYIIYAAPNHKLRVGNFHTKLQALKFENEIKKHFQNTIVLKDKIDLPKLETGASNTPGEIVDDKENGLAPEGEKQN
jgi:hypothetical protein